MSEAFPSHSMAFESASPNPGWSSTENQSNCRPANTRCFVSWPVNVVGSFRKVNCALARGGVPVTITPRYYGDGALLPAPTTLEMIKIEVAGDWCVCVGSGFDGRTLERLP